MEGPDNVSLMPRVRSDPPENPQRQTKIAHGLVGALDAEPFLLELLQQGAQQPIIPVTRRG